MTRATAKTIAAILDATAIKIPDRIALVSASPEVLLSGLTTTTTTATKSSSTAAIDDTVVPASSIPSLSRYTYGDVRVKTNQLAGFLKTYGYERNDILISDLPNVAENLMLQVACNRIGVTYATMKDMSGISKLNDTNGNSKSKVKGSVSATGTGFLAETNMKLPPLNGDYLLDLIHGTSGSSNSTLFGGLLDEFQFEDNEQKDDDEVLLRPPPPHAYYNNTNPFTNEEAIEMGTDAAWELAMTEDDVVCIAITLCHAFGMGSAVCGSLKEGATIVLPSVGGIRGCGVPSQRAEATLDVLESENCTLLFCDAHTLKAFPDEEDVLRTNPNLNLKGGVCKVGSGSQFLDGTVRCGGATLKTIGTRK